MAKERKLTEKEKARTERVDAVTRTYREQGYQRTDHTISITKANAMAFVFGAIFCVPLGIWYYVRNGEMFSLSILECLVYLALMIVLVVVHELIHGLVWGLGAEHHFQSIEFGFMKESLTPYCYCGEPLTRGQYLLGSFMPCLVLGILPGILSVFLGSSLLLMLGMIMILGAGGDLTVICHMLRFRSEAETVIIMDHPTECGFLVFEK